MDMATLIKVGQDIPDFNLKDHNNNTIAVRDFKGKKVLLSFHPLAWTSICGKQMKSLEDNKRRFDECNTVALGVSVDSVPSKKAWADKELGITATPLLADFCPHGGVARKFGIFRENEGFSERANIVIDEQQKVVFVKVYDIRTLPDIEEIVHVVQNKGGK